MKWQKLHSLFFLVMLIIVQLACATASEPTNRPISTAVASITSTAEPSATPIPPTSTSAPVPTPTFDFVVPSLVPGTGTVIGQVLWNKKPVAKAAVKLCEDFDYHGCHGTQYSTNSNQQGYYIFKQVKPGDYVVLINIFSTDWWVYQTEGTRNRKETAKADEITFLDSRSIYKIDLRLSEPVDGEVINQARPTLRWDEYPGAAFYKLALNSGLLDIYKDKDVLGNEFVVEKDLLDCKYSWKVQAFDDDGNKVGESKDGIVFKVKNSAASCIINLISPAQGAELKGDNVALVWSENPLAAYYIVSVTEFSSFKNILLNPKVDKGKPSIKLSQILEPGNYFWSVTAYNETESAIARSEISGYIRVQNP